MIERLSVEYGKKDKISFSVIPSPHYDTTTVGPYNFLLDFDTVLDHCSYQVLIDNEALCRLAGTHLGNSYPDYPFINQLISRAVSMLTSSEAGCVGTLHTGIHGTTTHLVPYPRLCFVMPSYLPLIPAGQSFHSPEPLISMTTRAYCSQALMTSCNLTSGTYLGSALLYKGDVHIDEIPTAIAGLNAKVGVKYANYIPNKYGWGAMHKMVVSQAATEGEALSSREPLEMLMLANNSAITESLTRICHEFDVLYAKRAFVHWYVGEGMSERGFMTSGRENAASLLIDYKEATTE